MIFSGQAVLSKFQHEGALLIEFHDAARVEVRDLLELRVPVWGLSKHQCVVRGADGALDWLLRIDRQALVPAVP